MWNKFICMLLGHEFMDVKEYYGTLSNGMKTFSLKRGKCERCGKEQEKESKPTKKNEYDE